MTVTVRHVGEFLSDGIYPYFMQVYWVRDDQLIPLGSNRQHRSIQLGKLPRGEIKLMANCPTGDGVVYSGNKERNRDEKPRSRVRQIRPGVVELYFESTIREGTRNDRAERHSFNDFKLTFIGAVVADFGVIVLLDKINDKDPETRKAARDGLKLVAPWIANAAGVR